MHRGGGGGVSSPGRGRSGAGCRRDSHRRRRIPCKGRGIAGAAPLLRCQAQRKLSRQSRPLWPSIDSGCGGAVRCGERPALGPDGLGGDHSNSNRRGDRGGRAVSGTARLGGPDPVRLRPPGRVAGRRTHGSVADHPGVASRSRSRCGGGARGSVPHPARNRIRGGGG